MNIETTEERDEAAAAQNEALRERARQIEKQLNSIQRRVRQQLQAEFAKGKLTGPQRLVMSVLVHSRRGVSLKQLSAKVSLAHSTVSGIVDRLVAQGLIQRQTRESDKRVTWLLPSLEVFKFLNNIAPDLTLNPLFEALAKGSAAELKSITTGLNTLSRLLEKEQEKQEREE